MAEYQIYKQNGKGEQCWFWHLTGKDGESIACSDEAFFKGKIVAVIKKVRQEVMGALIGENETSQNQREGCLLFKYHKNDAGDQWDWRLLDGSAELATGKISASKLDVKTALEHLQKEMANAKITWKNPEDDPDYQSKCDDRTETKGIPGS